MKILIISALGVGGATALGALMGFFLQGVSKKLTDMAMSFAAGVMLVASLQGLIVPAITKGRPLSLLLCLLGIACGAILLYFADKCIPTLEVLVAGKESSSLPGLHSVLIFLLAIAIHNLPEGLAAGVGFGAGDTARAISVSLGIALQNLPEGMVVIPPMLSIGFSRARAFFVAALTGLLEVAGTLLGYFLADASGSVLPFALGFAGGTMLYVICDEMIPSSCGRERSQAGSFAFIFGAQLMLLFDYLLA